MKKSYIVLVFMFILTGCYKKGQVEITNNVDIKVSLLFEKDGCKIYRFFDRGRAVYWTNCQGKTSYSYSKSNGKSTHRVDVQNETVE